MLTEVEYASRQAVMAAKARVRRRDNDASFVIQHRETFRDYTIGRCTYQVLAERLGLSKARINQIVHRVARVLLAYPDDVDYDLAVMFRDRPRRTPSRKWMAGKAA